ncbi:MAG: NAD-dependent epimerase/dehydratase family protein [Candidatus Pacearchaeota archaeon]
MNYAITGHRGLIGEYLKKRLDSEGHRCVLNIDQDEGFNVVDLMFKETKLNDKIDIFFHLAAQCKINESIASPMLAHKNNVDGIIAVLEFCRKHNIPKIVVASTSRVLSPERNPYVASKIYVEELTKAYSDCYGIKYLIVRPSTVYGPMFDKTSRLMNNFITAAFKGEDLLIYGDETKTLDFTYIDDFVEGIMIAIKNDWNREYNISGEQEELVLNVAEKIIKEIGSESEIRFLPPERAQPQKVSIDISALKKIGYFPKINIGEGIKKMINWYKNNPKAIEMYEDKGMKYYNGGE